MVKDIAKLCLALFGWCVFIVGVYGGATLFAAYMLNFGRPL